MAEGPKWPVAVTQVGHAGAPGPDPGVLGLSSSGRRSEQLSPKDRCPRSPDTKLSVSHGGPRASYTLCYNHTKVILIKIRE